MDNTLTFIFMQNILFQILKFLTHHYGGGDPTLLQLFSWLWAQTMPPPGGSVSLFPPSRDSLNRGRVAAAARPRDPRLEGSEVLALMTVTHLMLVYANLLAERKVVILGCSLR